jgi:hypothetical protein
MADRVDITVFGRSTGWQKLVERGDVKGRVTGKSAQKLKIAWEVWRFANADNVRPIKVYRNGQVVLIGFMSCQGSDPFQIVDMMGEADFEQLANLGRNSLKLKLTQVPWRYNRYWYHWTKFLLRRQATFGGSYLGAGDALTRAIKSNASNAYGWINGKVIQAGNEDAHDDDDDDTGWDEYDADEHRRTINF